MEALVELTQGIIEQYGFLGIFLLTAAEQFIFPVPADIFVGLGTSVGLDFATVLKVVLFGALVGSLIGYALGKWIGHPIVEWMFGKRAIDKAEKFIGRWGFWGVIIAGLTPVPFKLVVLAAGIFEMPFWKFVAGVLLGRMPRYILTAFAGSLLFKSGFITSPEMGAVILGALQGVTEFLPISSSGHLVLLEHFMEVPGNAQEMLLFDIILHGGSLLAILTYFWRDWVMVFKELGHMIMSRRIIKSSLTAKLVVGTIPAIIAGLLFAGALEGPLRNIKSVSVFFMIVAVFFLIVEWKVKKRELGEEVSLRKAVIIGSAQAFALIPGVSRAGSTIGMGMMTGLKREAAAKFSFMLGAAAIFAANVYVLITVRGGEVGLPGTEFTLIGFGTSFLVSIWAIHFMMKFLRGHTLRAFSLYLLLAGAIMLSFF